MWGMVEGSVTVEDGSTGDKGEVRLEKDTCT